MASKNVRKIYSKTSNELVKVDMADRDGQGNVIHETYAKKTEVGGGTKKYRHNIMARWSGGSGTGYHHGCLSFNFVDTSPTSYGDGHYAVYNADEFRAFIHDHMGLTDSDSNYASAVGGYQVGLSPVTELGTIVGLDYDGSSSWYMLVVGQNNYGRYFTETYFSCFPNISGKYVRITDRVEAL